MENDGSGIYTQIFFGMIFVASVLMVLMVFLPSIFGFVLGFVGFIILVILLLSVLFLYFRTESLQIEVKKLRSDMKNLSEP